MPPAELRPVDETSLSDHLRPPFASPLAPLTPLSRSSSDNLMRAWRGIPSPYQQLMQEVAPASRPTSVMAPTHPASQAGELNEAAYARTTGGPLPVSTAGGWYLYPINAEYDDPARLQASASRPPTALGHELVHWFLDTARRAGVPSFRLPDQTMHMRRVPSERQYGSRVSEEEWFADRISGEHTQGRTDSNARYREFIPSENQQKRLRSIDEWLTFMGANPNPVVRRLYDTFWAPTVPPIDPADYNTR